MSWSNALKRAVGNVVGESNLKVGGSLAAVLLLGGMPLFAASAQGPLEKRLENAKERVEERRGAQQINGVPGSPSATTTIEGNQIPAPEPKFGGVIKESVTESKTWWPPRIVPPKGAPNVLLIMTDDQGYGVSGHLRWCHPDAGAGPDRQGGAALHAVQLHRAVLADAGGADHRPQPPLGRLRRDHRAVDGFPGL